MGRPKSVEGSLASEGCGVGCCPRPADLGLLGAGSSTESRVSEVDLGRREGDEAAGAESGWTAADSGVWPFWARYSQAKLRLVQVLQGFRPLHCV